MLTSKYFFNTPSTSSSKVLNNFCEPEDYVLTDEDMDAIDMATYQYDYQMMWSAPKELQS